MPKMKTNRSAAKRFKTTAGGKVKRSRAYARHILTTKSTKRKRGLRRATAASSADVGGLKKLLPYLGIK
ncbi:MAG: 50S ribosomal protein L35 [Candidatus Adiutrix sp.]|jgi:large subunit ribosomal protein L35|nr:50S ribosomal protein L35 [Candidatus Adiutrix sp.]